jgi:hypothetical protein
MARRLGGPPTGSARTFRRGRGAFGSAVRCAAELGASIHRLGGHAPVTRTVALSSAHSGFSATFHPNGGLLGIAEGSYWAAPLTGGFLLTTVWYRQVGRRTGTKGPGLGCMLLTLEDTDPS